MPLQFRHRTRTKAKDIAIKLIGEVKRPLWYEQVDVCEACDE